MQFIDLKAQQEPIRDLIENKIKNILDHGQYINGPDVRELEDALAKYCETGYAVGCASGTDALLLALMAYGVGPGDAILTTPFTFIATAEVISLLGATPVFVDIDPATFNLDPEALEIAIEAFAEGDTEKHPLPAPCDKNTGEKISWLSGSCPLKPRGIIGVDLFGLPAEYDKISAIAKKHDMFIIEDGAQSFGASFHGKKACSLGNIGCTSFFPAKPLGCYGDGGMCFTDDSGLADIMRSLRVHGQGTDKYNNVRIGINGRLDTIQAAILLAKFTLFPGEVELRNEKAEVYAKGLARNPGLTAPVIPGHSVSAWAQYTVLAKNAEHRAAAQGALKAEKIPTAVYYPKPLHLQDAFADLGYKEGDFPVSETASQRVFSLPMHPYLKQEDQDKIIDILVKVNP